MGISITIYQTDDNGFYQLMDARSNEVQDVIDRCRLGSSLLIDKDRDGIETLLDLVSEPRSPSVFQFAHDRKLHNEIGGIIDAGVAARVEASIRAVTEQQLVAAYDVESFQYLYPPVDEAYFPWLVKRFLQLQVFLGEVVAAKRHLVINGG